MNLRFCLLAACFFFTTTAVFSQNYTTKKTATGKVKTAFDDGLAEVKAGKFGKAIVHFSKAVKLDSTFIDAIIWLGGCEAELKNLPQAAVAFEKALRIDPKYEPLVYWNLALVCRDQAKYGEAAKHATAFLKFEKAGSLKTRARAKRLAQNAPILENALKNPQPFDPKPLSNSINTKADEYLPTLTADGQTMIFCRRSPDENFYLSTRPDSVWQISMPLMDINSAENEGAQSLSPDGNRLFFTVCNRKTDGLGSCDLYFSERKTDGWSRPANLGPTVNGKSWDSQPCISADGQTLFFASDRTDGWGSLDIWLTQKEVDGRWGKPENLGGPVNSIGNDQAPFLHPDGQTLYFMSDGHPGMGVGDEATYDIFLSRKQADGTWGVPQNLGYPINSPGNEGAFFVALDGKTAFFAAKNRPGGQGGDDIYQFELPENARPQPMTFVKARVLDDETRQPLVAKTDFINLSDGKIWQSGQTDSKGIFLVSLPVGKNLGLDVSKKGWLFHSENFNLSDSTGGKTPFLLEIFLQKLPESVAVASQPGAEKSPAPGKPIILKNIFFETGSAILKTESTAELNRLRELLAENPSLKIRINGHTDDVGGEAENLLLSENRARAVFDFLLKNGIETGRLSFKGFGESQPVDSNLTAEGRAKNRRTEFEALKN